ncbi:MAG: hypothetical protein Q8P67_25650 [archaeon]|nr:hypothetical protein [archaeon]
MTVALDQVRRFDDAANAFLRGRRMMSTSPQPIPDWLLSLLHYRFDPPSSGFSLQLVAQRFQESRLTVGVVFLVFASSLLGLLWLIQQPGVLQALGFS